MSIIFNGGFCLAVIFLLFETKGEKCGKGAIGAIWVTLLFNLYLTALNGFIFLTLWIANVMKKKIADGIKGINSVFSLIWGIYAIITFFIYNKKCKDDGKTIWLMLFLFMLVAIVQFVLLVICCACVVTIVCCLSAGVGAYTGVNQNEA